MSIKFNPTGHLNITTDPMDLPEQSDGKNIVSGAMVRCKNLDLNYQGIAKTRRGSSLKSVTACTEVINHIQVLDTDRYEFGGDQIFQNEASIATGLTAANWDSFVYLAYNETDQSIFATNGTDRKRIKSGVVYEWGVEVPAAAPTLTEYVDYIVTFDWEVTYSSGSAVRFTQEDADETISTAFLWEVAQDDGTPLFDETAAYVSTELWPEESTQTGEKYQVKYTYARYDGTTLLAEGNPSAAAETTLGNYIYVAWAAATDTSITHVRFYRTLANFEDFYYAGEFAVGDSYGVLTATDEELGAEVSEDHDRPPLTGTVVVGPDFNGHCFMGVGRSLYFCAPKQPEYWPLLYNVECGTDQYPIVGLALLAGQLYAATAHEIFQVQGTGSTTFFPLPMAAITGTRSKEVFLPVKGYGIFHLGYDGLYLYTGSTDIKVSDTFGSIWNNETKHGVPPMNKIYIANCIMKKYENKLWFGYPGGDSQYCDNWLVLDLESNLLQGITGKISYYTFPWDITAMHMDESLKDVMVADEDGYIRKLDDIAQTADSGTAISYEIESKAFGALRKYFPRWSRYDVNLGEGATANGYVLLNDVSKQTHAITSSRSITKRLITGCTGDRLSVRISGTGAVSIYSAEIE